MGSAEEMSDSDSASAMHIVRGNRQRQKENKKRFMADDNLFVVDYCKRVWETLFSHQRFQLD